MAGALGPSDRSHHDYSAALDRQQVSHKGTSYRVDAKLYDDPLRPIPLLTAANGRKSMRLAGKYGDGLITDPLTWKQHKSEWQDGARNAGKNPGEMLVLVEQYVVVGDKSDAEKAANFGASVRRPLRAIIMFPIRHTFSKGQRQRLRWIKSWTGGQLVPTDKNI